MNADLDGRDGALDRRGRQLYEAVCSPDRRRIACGKGGGTYVMYYHDKRRVLDGSDNVERRP